MELYRTLLRITSYLPDWIFVIIPGWNSELEVGIKISEIPWGVRAYGLQIGRRFYAKVNLGAESIADLHISEIDN